MKWLIEFLKWKIAGRELEQLHRLKVSLQEYRRWLNEFPEIAAMLDNLALGHGFHRGLVFDSIRYKSIAELREYLRELAAVRDFEHKAQVNTIAAEVNKLRGILTYYREDCTGAEPSLSVFNRMVDEALSEKKGASDDF